MRVIWKIYLQFPHLGDFHDSPPLETFSIFYTVHGFYGLWQVCFYKQQSKMGHIVNFSVLGVGTTRENYVGKKAVSSLPVSRSPYAHGWKKVLSLSSRIWNGGSTVFPEDLHEGVILMSCKDDSVSGHRSSWCLHGLFLIRKNSQYRHMQAFYLIFILIGAQLYSFSSLTQQATLLSLFILSFLFSHHLLKVLTFKKFCSMKTMRKRKIAAIFRLANFDSIK